MFDTIRPNQPENTKLAPKRMFDLEELVHEKGRRSREIIILAKGSIEM